jgi:hypothetical protein
MVIHLEWFCNSRGYFLFSPRNIAKSTSIRTILFSYLSRFVFFISILLGLVIPIIILISYSFTYTRLVDIEYFYSELGIIYPLLILLIFTIKKIYHSNVYVRKRYLMICLLFLPILFTYMHSAQLLRHKSYSETACPHFLFLKNINCDHSHHSFDLIPRSRSIDAECVMAFEHTVIGWFFASTHDYYFDQEFSNNESLFRYLLRNFFRYLPYLFIFLLAYQIRLIVSHIKKIE